jgi:hydrogenase maturation protease
MSEDLQTMLHKTLIGRTAFVGIGNVDLGDDGFGVHLAEALAAAGLPEVFITHTVPENHVGTLAHRGYDHVVFLDAVNAGAEPGWLFFLDTVEMRNRFPQVSTHKLTLGTLARLIEAEGSTRVWLLGIQPTTLKQGVGLSEPVVKTLNLLKTLLLDTFSQRRSDKAECRVS